MPIYGVGLMVWHLLLNSNSIWILFKNISCSCSAENVPIESKGSFGILLLYKRLNIGGFSWPRTKEEAMEITPEQFQMLMQGLSIVAKHPIKELMDPPKTM